MSIFIGRKSELKELSQFLQKKSASLLVVKGRRRIGKSRLIEEFALKNQVKLYAFAGLAPLEETSAQDQRDEFSKQLGLSGAKFDDWSDLFKILTYRVKSSRVIVLLDEISWMAFKDPNFLGKLKNAWDLYFKKNPKLIVVICGSASLWIEKNILSSTAFHGRVSYVLTLEEMPISDCNEFWGVVKNSVSAYEKFKILSVTGGIPKYLEEINPKISAEKNIKELCFKKGGLLTNEFNQIFSELFSRRGSIYKKIAQLLVNGYAEYGGICEKLEMGPSGLLSDYLNDLKEAGFIKRDYTWRIKTGEDVNLSHYRLSDNYLRFYLKYIDKNSSKIERNAFRLKTLASLPGWDIIMGLQFENLVLNNRHYIHDCLELSSDEIVSDNPFFQRKTKRIPGCQIDYLIQTKFNSLYVCEVKFSIDKIGGWIIEQMEKKLKALKIPSGFSYRPVLIHVNGVSKTVVEKDYFANIIDFSELF